MTTLIYRGISYTRTSKAVSRKPQDVIYRGQRHDGLTQHSPAVVEGVEMRYRSVSYTRTPVGRVVPTLTRAGWPLSLSAMPS